LTLAWWCFTIPQSQASKKTAKSNKKDSKKTDGDAAKKRQPINVSGRLKGLVKNSAEIPPASVNRLVLSLFGIALLWLTTLQAAGEYQPWKLIIC